MNVISKSIIPITVFTATYNRRSILRPLYESLCSQTMKDFEWVVVDDGSIDDTESLVWEWQKSAPFPIIYLWQENGGLMRAHNKGVTLARGELFLRIDSDDTLMPEALERFWLHWQNIPEKERNSFAGVAGLCRWSDDYSGAHSVSQAGEIIGSRLPKPILDSTMIEIRTRYHIIGERCGIQRTDIMREYPFPVFPGEKFISEAVVWRRIAMKYRTRYVNEVFRVCTVTDTGLTANRFSRFVQNPCGYALLNNEAMKILPLGKERLKATANYVRAGLHAHYSWWKILAESSARWWTALMFLPGLLLYWRDLRVKEKK